MYMATSNAPELGEFIYQGETSGETPQKVCYLAGGAGWPLLLLHGWGCTSETMLPLFRHFAAGFRVYDFDLPGFGLSPEPSSAWDTAAYANMLAAFIAANCEKPPIIIGHSFGGRLALRLGARQIPHKMILTGCAGLPPHRGLDYYAKVYSYKAAKKLLSLPGLSAQREKLLEEAKQKSGSADYRSASEVMRGVFVKTVNEDQTANLAKIAAPTILYWGENDTATPLADGEKMAKQMRDAALIVKKGGTHYAFLEFLPDFLAIADNFLQPERAR